MCDQCKVKREEIANSLPDLGTRAGFAASLEVSKIFIGSLGSALNYFPAFRKVSMFMETNGKRLGLNGPENATRTDGLNVIKEMAEETRRLALDLQKLYDDTQALNGSSPVATDEPADGAKILPFNNGDDKFLSDLGIG